MSKVKKKEKVIKIDLDKCNGCRACEMVCSAFHATPKYSSNNPARSRIRVIHDPLRDIYLPVYAGEYTAAECMGKDKYVIDGKEYSECDFCRASCPSRDAFKEPDSGIPLKCDMCEHDPAQEKPLCVQWSWRRAARRTTDPERARDPAADYGAGSVPDGGILSGSVRQTQ